MTSILEAVNTHLGNVVLQYDGGGGFQVLNCAPPWFRDIFALHSDTYCANLQGHSLFLDNFFVDAFEAWEGALIDPVLSGPFIEVLGSGKEVALEATALTVEHQRILVLSRLGQSYWEAERVLQRARENLLHQERLEQEVHQRARALREGQTELASRLIHAAGVRDEETGGHIQRIGLYSAEMSSAIGWDAYRIDEIKAAAPMHDIGKIGIPDSILKKPGRLTPEEFEVMKRHAQIGADILEDSNNTMIQLAADIARCHHERWDGRGYPRRLAGEKIPLAARIVSIVDVYDALLQDRIYKPPLEESVALGMMDKLVGRQFDPDLYQIFRERLPILRSIREAVPD